MNEDFKKIAKGLGVVLPACLLTIGAANAATTMPTRNNDVPSACIKMNKGNDVISHLMANTTNYSSDKLTPDHTNRHQNKGNTHTDRYTDESHSDYHSNRDAYNQSNTGQCIPHSNSHTDYGQNRHKHTNTGDRYHTDEHVDRTINTECPSN